MIYFCQQCCQNLHLKSCIYPALNRIIPQPLQDVKLTSVWYRCYCSSVYLKYKNVAAESTKNIEQIIVPVNKSTSRKKTSRVKEHKIKMRKIQEIPDQSYDDNVMKMNSRSSKKCNI